jgi:non-ribosomal peptide synthetase component F
MDEAAEQQLLVEFNNTVVPYPEDETIARLFEKQAKRTPSETALVFEGEHTNYRLLNERSNQLARYLQNKGVVAGALIPICIERSVEMIVGVLAILKAGAAMFPSILNIQPRGSTICLKT